MSNVATRRARFVGPLAPGVLMAKGFVVIAFGELSSAKRTNFAATTPILMSDFGRMGTTPGAESATCRAWQMGIDDDGQYPLEKST
jgi:hypothetical protein